MSNQQQNVIFSFVLFERFIVPFVLWNKLITAVTVFTTVYMYIHTHSFLCRFCTRIISFIQFLVWLL